MSNYGILQAGPRYSRAGLASSGFGVGFDRQREAVQLGVVNGNVSKSRARARIR